MSKIWGVSDLHLSFGTNKPMEIFGDRWLNHSQLLAENWQKNIKACDVVLVAGDISWAMTLSEFQPDLDYLNKLPGKKVFIRGNHDYWWSSIKKVRAMLKDNYIVIQNDSVLLFDKIAVAGTRGWLCPSDREFTEHDLKIYKRELNRLELSLQDAIKKDADQIWVMMHYMPVNEKHQQNEFINLCKKYNVEKIIYGHLHSNGHYIRIEGQNWDIEFHLISSDYIDFNPVLLADLS